MHILIDVQIYKYGFIYVQCKYLLEGLGINFPVRAKKTEPRKCDNTSLSLECTLHRIIAKTFKTTRTELFRPAAKTKRRSPLISFGTDLRDFQ